MHTWILGMALAAAATTLNAQQRQEMPTAFDGGHFYATPALADGRPLRLLVDTGGGGGAGWYVLYQAAVARLHLATDSCQLDEKITTVKAIAYRAGKGLAAINDTPCHAPAIVIDEAGDGEDGMLGPGYLMNHIWTFDYPARQLWLESPRWKAPAGMHHAGLGFVRKDGKAVMGYARMTLAVDGAPIDLLLDTGATAHPTDAGMASVESVNGHGIAAASYIVSSVFDQWHRKHPQWRVIDAGDNLKTGHYVARLIEVPEVTIAGWKIGPVWFTERPDGAFTGAGGMSDYTDKTVFGAVGGNVFRHVVMTLDYPRATAWFACASGCVAEKAP